jgi:hypothetical protein
LATLFCRQFFAFVIARGASPVIAAASIFFMALLGSTCDLERKNEKGYY